MKRTIFLIFLGLLWKFSPIYSQKTISVQLIGIPDSYEDSLYLQYYHQGDLHMVDYAIANGDGNYTLQVPESHANGLMQIVLGQGERQAELIYNSKEDIQIKCSYKGLQTGVLEVLQSVENEAYVQLIQLQTQFTTIAQKINNEKKIINPFQKDYYRRLSKFEEQTEALHQELNKNLDKIRLKYPETFTANTLVQLSKIPTRVTPALQEKYDGYLSFLNDHYLDSIDFNDPYVLNHYAFLDQVYSYLGNYVHKSEKGLKHGIDYILSRIGTNTKINDLIFNRLLDTYIELGYEEIVSYLLENQTEHCQINLNYESLKKLNQMQQLKIGGKAPDIFLYTDEKKPSSLENFSSQNRLTIVYFWISWCQHCKDVTPILYELSKKYAKKGLGVFAVSLDESRNEWESAMPKSNSHWINVAELLSLKKSSIATKYRITSTPNNLLLDEKGLIIAKNLFGEELQQFIEKRFP